MNQRSLLVCCITVLFSLCLYTLTASGSGANEAPATQEVAAAQENGPATGKDEKQIVRTPVMVKWLHLLDENEGEGIENSSVLAFAPKVPGDLIRVLKTTGARSGSGGFWKVLFLALVSIAFGFLVVLGAKRYARKGITKLQEIAPPAGDGMSCLWAGFIRGIPSLAAIVSCYQFNYFTF